MSFFKKYNGTTNRRLVRLERMTWTLIYGGLLSVLLGFSLQKAAVSYAGAFMVGGGASALLGVLLILLRARLSEQG
jgi:hypothetical protein